jgi:hypothetical protein
MNLYLGAGAFCLVVWGILVYAVATPSGWVHAALAVGFLLVARGIVGKVRT